MTMNCDRASFLMSKEQDKPLSLLEKASLKYHFIVCAACIHTRNQMNRIREICGLPEMQIPNIPDIQDACLDQESKDQMKSKLKAKLNQAHP